MFYSSPGSSKSEGGKLYMMVKEYEYCKIIQILRRRNYGVYSQGIQGIRQHQYSNSSLTRAKQIQWKGMDKLINKSTVSTLNLPLKEGGSKYDDRNGDHNKNKKNKDEGNMKKKNLENKSEKKGTLNISTVADTTENKIVGSRITSATEREDGFIGSKGPIFERQSSIMKENHDSNYEGNEFHGRKRSLGDGRNQNQNQNRYGRGGNSTVINTSSFSSKVSYFKQNNLLENAENVDRITADMDETHQSYIERVNKNRHNSKRVYDIVMEHLQRYGLDHQHNPKLMRDISIFWCTAIKHIIFSAVPHNEQQSEALAMGRQLLDLFLEKGGILPRLGHHLSIQMPAMVGNVEATKQAMQKMKDAGYSLQKQEKFELTRAYHSSRDFPKALKAYRAYVTEFGPRSLNFNEHNIGFSSASKSGMADEGFALWKSIFVQGENNLDYYNTTSTDTIIANNNNNMNNNTSDNNNGSKLNISDLGIPKSEFYPPFKFYDSYLFPRSDKLAATVAACYIKNGNAHKALEILEYARAHNAYKTSFSGTVSMMKRINYADDSRDRDLLLGRIGRTQIRTLIKECVLHDKLELALIILHKYGGSFVEESALSTDSVHQIRQEDTYTKIIYNPIFEIVRVLSEENWITAQRALLGAVEKSIPVPVPCFTASIQACLDEARDYDAVMLWKVALQQEAKQNEKLSSLPSFLEMESEMGRHECNHTAQASMTTTTNTSTSTSTITPVENVQFVPDYTFGLEFDKAFYFTNILIGTNPGHVLNVVYHASSHLPHFATQLQSAAIKSLLSNRSLYLSPQEMAKTNGGIFKHADFSKKNKNLTKVSSLLMPKQLTNYQREHTNKLLRINSSSSDSSNNTKIDYVQLYDHYNFEKVIRMLEINTSRGIAAEIDDYRLLLKACLYANHNVDQLIEEKKKNHTDKYSLYSERESQTDSDFENLKLKKKKIFGRRDGILSTAQKQPNIERNMLETLISDIQEEIAIVSKKNEGMKKQKQNIEEQIKIMLKEESKLYRYLNNQLDESYNKGMPGISTSLSQARWQELASILELQVNDSNTTNNTTNEIDSHLVYEILKKLIYEEGLPSITIQLATAIDRKLFQMNPDIVTLILETAKESKEWIYSAYVLNEVWNLNAMHAEAGKVNVNVNVNEKRRNTKKIPFVFTNQLGLVLQSCVRANEENSTVSDYSFPLPSIDFEIDGGNVGKAKLYTPATASIELLQLYRERGLNIDVNCASFAAQSAAQEVNVDSFMRILNTEELTEEALTEGAKMLGSQNRFPELQILLGKAFQYYPRRIVSIIHIGMAELGRVSGVEYPLRLAIQMQAKNMFLNDAIYAVLVASCSSMEKSSSSSSPLPSALPLPSLSSSSLSSSSSSSSSSFSSSSNVLSSPSWPVALYLMDESTITRGVPFFRLLLGVFQSMDTPGTQAFSLQLFSSLLDRGMLDINHTFQQDVFDLHYMSRGLVKVALQYILLGYLQNYTPLIRQIYPNPHNRHSHSHNQITKGVSLSLDTESKRYLEQEQVLQQPALQQLPEQSLQPLSQQEEYTKEKDSYKYSWNSMDQTRSVNRELLLKTILGGGGERQKEDVMDIHSKNTPIEKYFFTKPLLPCIYPLDKLDSNGYSNARNRRNRFNIPERVIVKEGENVNGKGNGKINSSGKKEKQQFFLPPFGRNISIVSGKGVDAKIKKTIQSFLYQCNPPIYAEQLENNAGRIKINRRSLERWLIVNTIKHDEEMRKLKEEGELNTSLQVQERQHFFNLDEQYNTDDASLEKVIDAVEKDISHFKSTYPLTYNNLNQSRKKNDDNYLRHHQQRQHYQHQNDIQYNNQNRYNTSSDNNNNSNNNHHTKNNYKNLRDNSPTRQSLSHTRSNKVSISPRTTQTHTITSTNSTATSTSSISNSTRMRKPPNMMKTYRLVTGDRDEGRDRDSSSKVSRSPTLRQNTGTRDEQADNIQNKRK